MGALSDLRILECGDFVAAPFAASLLGHMGADVVKIEPLEGDSNRRRGPFPDGRKDGESGGLHLFLDQAKRYAPLLRMPNVGLALDPEWRLGPGQLSRLPEDSAVRPPCQCQQVADPRGRPEQSSPKRRLGMHWRPVGSARSRDPLIDGAR